MQTFFASAAHNMTASAQTACAPFSCADNGTNSMMIMLMDTILVVSIFILVLLVLVQLLHCRDRRTMTNRQCA